MGARQMLLLTRVFAVCCASCQLEGIRTLTDTCGKGANVREASWGAARCGFGALPGPGCLQWPST
jgi:hypothetical protein